MIQALNYREKSNSFSDHISLFKWNHARSCMLCLFSRMFMLLLAVNRSDAIRPVDMRSTVTHLQVSVSLKYVLSLSLSDEQTISV